MQVENVTALAILNESFTLDRGGLKLQMVEGA